MSRLDASVKLKIGSLSFIWNFLFERETMKHNQLTINGSFQFHGFMHSTKMKHEADKREKGAGVAKMKGDAKGERWVGGGLFGRGKHPC